LQIKRRVETLEKKKTFPRVKKTKQECSDDDEDCAAPTCLRPTGKESKVLSWRDLTIPMYVNQG
jgi:hypothetical protein